MTRKKLREIIRRIVQEEVIREASTTNGNPGMAYQTPYAFSDVGLDRDKKKRKIATQLGYKLLNKKKVGEEYAGLTEECKYNISKIATDVFRPKK